MAARKTDLQEAEREKVTEALKASGHSKSYVSVILGLGTALHEWLKTGKGLSAAKVEKVVNWAEGILKADAISLAQAAGAEFAEAAAVASPRSAMHIEVGVQTFTKEAEQSLERILEGMDGLQDQVDGRREPVVVETVLSLDTRAAQESIDKMLEGLASLQAVEQPGPSPADLMVQAVAVRGALKELAELGLDLPTGARLTISLEWCA